MAAGAAPDISRVSAEPAVVPDPGVPTRIGRGELAILLAGARELRCAEPFFRVRSALADLAVADVPVSASLGAVASPSRASVADAIRLADERLYVEKTQPPQRGIGPQFHQVLRRKIRSRLRISR
jgi:predicted signal transduction protein with EAL and GGDEF domain